MRLWLACGLVRPQTPTSISYSLALILLSRLSFCHLCFDAGLKARDGLWTDWTQHLLIINFAQYYYVFSKCIINAGSELVRLGV